MKKIMLFALLFSMSSIHGQTHEGEKIEAAVNYFLTALKSGNRESLQKITHEKLSYGHSNGRLENQEEFIEKLATGVSKFLTVNITNQTMYHTKHTAIVRHRLDANIIDNGKENEVHLNVLMVFEKENGAWKLLARQAVKIIN
jgi:ketosteroid isomerase-like protein